MKEMDLFGSKNNTNIITVYHGSKFSIENPDIEHNKGSNDFGNGFYTTSYREQARKFAFRLGGRFVNEYEYNSADFSNLKVLEFNKYDIDWLKFVINCRRHVHYVNGYDVVIGPVADDNVRQTVNAYESKKYDDTHALEELKFNTVNNQIVFCSNTSLNILQYKKFYLI